MNEKKYTKIIKNIKEEIPLKRLIKKNFSFKQAQQIIKEGKIRVNEQGVHLSQILKPGDKVDFYLPLKENNNKNIIPVDKPIEIIYEDEDILVVNKEPNLLTIAHNDSKFEDNLAGRIYNYYLKTNKNGTAIQFLSRLDRETSGLILLAKNSYAHSKLQEMQKFGKVDKRYLCVVHNLVYFDRKNVVLNIKRSNTLDQFEISKNGEYARTLFNTIWRSKKFSILEAKLYTGKTHQIRLHANAIKHPLLGEKKYFNSNVDINRFALHSWKLSFKHPIRNKNLNLTADVPEDLKKYYEETITPKDGIKC